MKTAMDYIRERDERVDVAGKTARLKEWCERFFGDKDWAILNDGTVHRLQPFHCNSAVTVEVTLCPIKAECVLQWDVGEKVRELTVSAHWTDSDFADFTNRIEASWEQAVYSAPPIPQIYFSSRIPVSAE